jgi:AcrR family transcriptional regulator
MPPHADTHQQDASRQHRKTTQRERLLDAAVQIAATHGYHNCTVTKIVGAAGVSRPTFYDYFSDRDTCLLAALATLNDNLLSLTADAVEHADASRAPFVALDAIIDFCHARPAEARLWLIEWLAGVSSMLDARDNGIDALARVVDQAYLSASPDALVPDIDSGVLLGGIQRLLASRTRQGESLVAARPELHAWIESYSVPRHSRRSPHLSISDSPPAEPSAEPPFGARPGHRSEVDYPGRDPGEYHRDRIFYAAAQAFAGKRLEDVVVSDIAKRAGVGYRRLTALFSDKERLFSGMHELGYLRTLAATSGAYFSQDAWPDRVWAGGVQYTHYVAGNPSLAHIGFVMPYSAGPHAARHMDEILKAFTLFLHEGYAHVPAGRERPSSVALMAIAATIFDSGYRTCRTGNAAHLPGLLPQAVFISLAPFLGPQATMRFIDNKWDSPRSAAA